MAVKKIEFDDVLEEIGSFGRYQFVIFLIAALKDVLASWHNLYFMFSNADPGWTCANQTSSANTSIAVQTNSSISDLRSCDCPGNEVVFGKEFTSIVTEWTLTCSSAWIPPLSVTIQLLGVLVGAAIYGQLADLYGRKWTFLSTIVFAIITQILAGTSGDVYWFFVWRTLNGVALGGSMGISYVYTGEFVGPRWRSLLYGAGFWDYGTCLMAAIAYWVRDWRHLAYVTGTSQVLLIPTVYWLVPESPRWLIQSGRRTEAERVIRYIASFNKRPIPKPETLNQLFSTVETEGVKRYSYLHLFTTSRAMATRTTVLIIIWFTMAEIYYAINTAVPSFSGNVYFNVTYSALSMIPVQAACVILFRRYRRKACFLVYSAITSSCLLGVAVLEILNPQSLPPMLTISLALVGKSFAGGMWLLTGMMTLEIYPTLMRTLGMGAGNTLCRIGGSIAPQIQVLGLLVHPAVPYVIHGSLLLVSTACCLLFLPETLNKPLPEMDDIPDTGSTLFLSKSSNILQSSGVFPQSRSGTGSGREVLGSKTQVGLLVNSINGNEVGLLNDSGDEEEIM